MIDWGLFGDPIDSLFIYTGSETYKIISILEQGNGVYEIEVVNIFSETHSKVLIHSRGRDVIWFEALTHSKDSSYVFEGIINDLKTGVENPYYRRSGPDK